MLAVMTVIALISMAIGGCSDRTPLDVREAREAAQLAAEFLADQIGPDGLFADRQPLEDGASPASGYSGSRHAGSVRALAEFERQSPGHIRRRGLEDAAAYLRDRATAPVETRIDLRALWSDPAVTGGDGPRAATAGGTGRALAALVAMEAIEPRFTPVTDLRALAAFVVFMQKPNGSFFSGYVPSAGGRQDGWPALSEPGDVALGLIALHERHPAPGWLTAAANALIRLARERDGMTDVPPDSRALVATARLLARDLPVHLAGVRPLLLAHAEAICRSILSTQVIDATRPALHGGFSERGFTRPAAMRLEGLQAALAFLPPDHPLLPDIRSAVSLGIRFLVRAQVKEGPLAGAMPRAVDAGDGNPVPNRDDVRIDTVEHTLGAFMAFLSLHDQGLLGP